MKYRCACGWDTFLADAPSDSTAWARCDRCGKQQVVRVPPQGEALPFTKLSVETEAVSEPSPLPLSELSVKDVLAIPADAKALLITCDPNAVWADGTAQYIRDRLAAAGVCMEVLLLQGVTGVAVIK